jgi:glycosyltransferase involved in cell wall biosynthesis
MPTTKSHLPQTGRKPCLTIWTDCGALGGIAEFVHSLTMGMVTYGYDVTIVAPEFNFRRREEERAAGICHHEVQLPERQIRGPVVCTKEETLDLLNAIQADVILFADGSAISSLLAKECALQLNIPMIVSIGNVLGEHVVRAQQRPNFQKICEAAKGVVAVSRHNGELLAKHYPIGTAEVKVIHYGRPKLFFEPTDAARRSERRAEIGVAPGELLFMTAARYDHIKGYDLRWKHFAA